MPFNAQYHLLKKSKKKLAQIAPYYTLRKFNFFRFFKNLRVIAPWKNLFHAITRNPAQSI
jgi:hypothetical protein